MYPITRAQAIRKSSWILGLALCAGFLAAAPAAWSDDAPPPQPAAVPLTYAKDIASIFNQKCVACHRPGQIAPMSLLQYKDIRPWVKSIKKQVSEQTMPPWFADPAFGSFANDARLSTAEIQKITAWVDQGAPIGDPLDLPPAPKFRDDVWKIGRPDATFTMPQPFVMGDNLGDHYQDFMVPTNLAEDKWVTQIELRPGNLEIVHHILVFVVPPSGGRQGGGGGFGNDGGILRAALSGGGLLAKYAPGNNPDVFAPGAGKLIKAGSSLLFQMHYHKDTGPGTAKRDQSSIGFKFASAPVKDPVTTAWIVNPMLMIPPNGENVPFSSAFVFNDDGKIHSLFPHMHYRGKGFKFEAVYPGGERETLLNVPAYSFDWQTTYVLKEPKAIPKGTKIVATGVFDNSANNTRNPDPSQRVTWGEETTDEMMLGLMDYTYDHDKENQGMIGLPEGMMAMLPPELRDIGAGGLGQLSGKLGELGKRFGGPGGLKNLKGVNLQEIRRQRQQKQQ